MNTENPTYLFVYGTLRTNVDAPVKSGIAKNLHVVAEYEIRGKLYDMGGYPAAVPAGPGENSLIRGEILRVDDPEHVLAVLDRYERYHPDNKDESEYRRDKIEVELPDGKKTEAWIYWYNRSVQGKPQIDYTDYLDYIRKNNTIY